jgi:tRNA dimethylallyltransferase
MNELITILGPTASGKTKLAAHLAAGINGEVISADSRQVYRGMDIGTGKDLADFQVANENIPYHLIDIVEPGYEYNVYEFQRDFLEVFRHIHNNGKVPIMCGGTGLYIDAVVNSYQMDEVPHDKELRATLEKLSDRELIHMLAQYGDLHNTTDTTDRLRTIRAIEILEHQKDKHDERVIFPKINSINFGIYFEREVIRQRITERLRTRLEEGMVREVNDLLENGLSPEQLTFYGLEYRFVTQFVTGSISYDEMFQNLNTAIHQFAKRQMTWFRRMERKGNKIIWIDGSLPLEQKVSFVKGCI